jgi:hypothetical protein
LDTFKSITLNNQRSPITFDDVSLLFKDIFEIQQIDREINEHVKEIEVKRENDGTYSMKVTLDPFNFDIVGEDLEKLKKIFYQPGEYQLK